MLYVPQPAANWDPTVYPEPEKFDIHRNSNVLSFGKGMHFCLGVHLARLELEIMIESFVKNLPDDHRFDEDRIIWNPTDFAVRKITSMPLMVGR